MLTLKGESNRASVDHDFRGVGQTGYFKALDFPRASVREVAIGKGWSKGGLEVVLLPYKAQVDKMAEGRAVSFFAPDEYGCEVRFAVDMYSEEVARKLSDMLAKTAASRSA